MTTERQIRRTLDELDQLTEAMWKRHEAWEAAHPGQYQPLVCDGIGLVGRCTDTSVWLAERLKGVVHGYHHDDNPDAALGEGEGGHDFVIVDGRWLVDWWAKDTYQERDLYDLEDPADQELVLRLYGPANAWRAMSLQDFVQYKARIREFRESQA